jgi:hypothetical protein
LIILDKGVKKFVREEARKSGIKNPIVLIMDCGCMMDKETVELDIKEKGTEKGYDFYLEVDGIKFFVNPKVKHIADIGRIGVMNYGEGRFRRLEFYPPNKKM